MRLTNSRAMRDADGSAVHVLGVPSTLLMTNAARHVASAAIGLMGENKSAVIFCGSGNNGGDGIGAAVYLIRRGIGVRCFLAGERSKMTPDCAEMERRLIELGGVLENFDPDDKLIKLLTERAGVIIDALFGIGLNSAPRGKALAAVRLINEAKVPVISADIASGVEADTGRIPGEAVRADVTVTFSMAKIGHFTEPGCICCGKLLVVDIGIPAEALKNAGTNVFAACAGDIALPARPKISHKGDFGKLLIISGSVGYTGAPVLCARAAARCGAGLIYLGVPGKIYEIVAGSLLESMPFPLDDRGNGRISMSALPAIMDKLQSCDICVMGCGLSRSEEIGELIRSVVVQSPKQLVIDADGLFALGGDPGIIKSAKIPPVLTPHEGEYLRLGGVLTGDRVSDARGFAESRNCILVLKGHRTICAFPDGEVYIINAGNPGMAKGGSGDVLSGMIGAFSGQLSLKKAVITACAVHALAGDLCAERYGEYSMLPSDMIEAIPEITKTITR
ncbi:MAG: NAD(P)H-hydrate dehydratase [Oscillospiraceae bacterium]|nr:NAD(P)H-hydrate dehydratase [Oscillospiraceae bacterium]